MAEWVPPPHIMASPPPPPPPPPRHPPDESRPDDHHRHQPSTFVVQVPKDQIYRVPPQEHAVLVERYRNPPSRRNPCTSCCCRFICFFLLLVFLVAFLGAVLYFAVRPSLPNFAITKVSIDNPNPSHRQSSKPKYEITMKATNGNPVMSISYYKGGTARLMYQTQEIATGHIPEFDQEASDSTPLRVTFSGRDSLPRELQRKDVSITMKLSSDLPLKLKIGPLTVPGMDLFVVCELKVTNTSKATQIKSQICKTSLN